MSNPTTQGADQARGRSAIKQRQLLMDPDSDHPTIKSDTSIEDLVKTFQKALDSLNTNSSPPLQIRLIFRLRKQGLVLELSDAEAAAWLREPATRLDFTTKLGGKIRLKDRQYNIVVPFFPISTDIQCQKPYEELRKTATYKVEP